MTPAEWIFLAVLFVMPHVTAITAMVLLIKESRNGR